MRGGSPMNLLAVQLAQHALEVSGRCGGVAEFFPKDTSPHALTLLLLRL